MEKNCREEEKNITCCFSGHRMEKLPWRANEDDARCLALKTALHQSLHRAYEAGYRRFLCGMATGCDMYFCEAVIALRDACPDVILEAVVPFRGQPDRWKDTLKTRYAALLEQSDRVTVLRELYTSNCMMERNYYMVNHSTRLIAAYRGITGGTMKTILYATRSGLQIDRISVPE